MKNGNEAERHMKYIRGRMKSKRMYDKIGGDVDER